MTMVVPYVAGGATDIVARILTARLSEVLHQQVIVENIGGAGGMAGTNRVAKAPPDGYQFVLGNVGTHAQNQTLYKNPSGQPPCCRNVSAPSCLSTSNDGLILRKRALMFACLLELTRGHSEK